MKGSPDAAQLLISVVADAGTPLPAVGFYAEKLDAYPVDKRGASDYLQRLIRAQEAKGCQRAGAAMTTQLGGVSFLRADCEDGKGHEAVLGRPEMLLRLFSSLRRGTPKRPINSSIQRKS
jgi:hypothetical protein